MRINSAFVAGLASLILSLFPGAVQAWGPDGHKMVGDIAEQFLTDEAQQAVIDLLKVDRLANGQPSGRTTLGEVASWPDEIRSLPSMAPTKAWHFDDIPLCGTATPQKICPNGNCASVQLARLLAVLKDGRAPSRERNEALKWVVHLMGDIHQPLHATDNDDYGGNKVLVSFFGETKNKYGDLNLHSIWDENIVERMLAAAGGPALFYAQPIGETDKKAWETGTVKDWLAESHAYAASVVYGNLSGGYVCNQAPTQRLDLGDSYYQATAPLVALQLRRAGVRLAKVLNAALSSDHLELTVHGLSFSEIAPHLGSAPHLPDPVKTPGRAALNAAKAVCGITSTQDDRHVTPATKKAVYEGYGIARCEGYCSGSEGCEVDHLISLELGGANTEDNLWPQPYQGEWNAHGQGSP